MYDRPDPASSEPQERKKTVLVIEDDPTIASFLAEYLHEEKAYHVYLAANASRAFEMLQTLQPNLIVLDHFLPGMKGLEMHNQLQTMHGCKHIPVLIISATPLSEEASQHRLPFLQKPFTLEELDVFIDGLGPQQDDGWASVSRRNRSQQTKKCTTS